MHKAGYSLWSWTCYVKGIIDFGLLYPSSNELVIVIMIEVEMWMIERAPLDLFSIWGVRHLLRVLKGNQL